VGLKIDKTGPSASLAVTAGTLGSHGWYTSNVTIAASGSDAVSGGVTCTADQHLINDSSGTTFNGTCTNAAGLSTDAAPLTVKRDATAPTLSFELNPAANADGWNNQASVTVEYTCSDATSGLDANYGDDLSGCWSPDAATTEGLTSFVNRTVYDMAGNSSSASPDVRIDRTAPTVNQGSVSGTIGDGGWYTSDVTVPFTASDGLSGLKHPLADASFTLTASGEGSVLTDSRDVYDKAGNFTPAGPLSFKIDDTEPQVTCDDPMPGWSGNDISIHCTASDDGSGLADPSDEGFDLTTNVPDGTETDNASIASREVCDVAGLCTTVGPWAGLRVDKKAPEVSCDPADSVWHADDQTVSCAVSDNGSGSTTSSVTLSTSVGANTATDDAYTGSQGVADNVGNTATAGPVGPFKIDKAAPTATASASANGGPYTADTWTKYDVTVSYGCDDGTGSGVASTGSDDVVTDEGITVSVSGDCTDNVGNTSSATFGPIKIDTTAPTATASASANNSPYAADTWTKYDVTVSYGCDDGTGSGVASTGLDDVVTDEGITASVSGDCTDNVGNTSTAAFGPIKIDKTGPLVNLLTPGDGASYLLNSVVASGYSCSDALAGLSTCSGTTASGANVETGTVGPHSFVVSALDLVGNSTTVSHNYAVGYATTGSCLGSAGHDVLQPINPDSAPTTSAFKKGSTVPVKFRVCDANGNSIGSAGVVTSFKLVKKAFGAVETTVTEDPVSTTPDSAFRWSSTDQQWIFNLSTKNLTGGYTYSYEIGLNDGTRIAFHFYLKS
jgi:hypothetical protein